MRQARSSTDDARHRANSALRALLGLTACTAFSLAACAATPPAQAPGTVAVEGCPEPGVEAGCLMVRTGDGTLYDITAASPPPPVDGRAIRLTGRRSDAMSFCMQGTRLADITWSYSGVACAP
ncbi:MAG: hypothetical protein AB7I59_15575 [Geminicoccaceae bacterium]